MPLFDNRTKLVSSKSHSMEIGQTNFALNLFTNKSKFAKVSFGVVQITKRNFINAALEEIA